MSRRWWLQSQLNALSEKFRGGLRGRELHEAATRIVLDPRTRAVDLALALRNLPKPDITERSSERAAPLTARTEADDEPADESGTERMIRRWKEAK